VKQRLSLISDLGHQVILKMQKALQVAAAILMHTLSKLMMLSSKLASLANDQMRQ